MKSRVHTALLVACISALVLTTFGQATNNFPFKGATGYFSPRRLAIPSHFDYIVVGTGPAGSAVAARLSENPANSVLVLERGSDTSNQQLFDVPYNWGPVTVSDSDQYTMIDFHNEPAVNWNEAKSRVSSGRGLGGTSLINSEMWVRGNSYDYDNWAATYGAEGWSYNDVLPFFKKIETNPFKYGIDPAYHGNDGPLHISPGTVAPPADLYLVNAAAAYGIPFNPDHNGPNQLSSSLGGISFHDMSVFNGTRQSAYKSYLRPNLDRRNLWVVDSAHVTKVNFNSQNRAVSVTWVDTLKGVIKTSTAGKEIVLSTGGIQTPKLLQLSGIGPALELEALGITVVANRPGVGQNLMDHPITNLGVGGAGLPWPTDNTFDAETFNEWVVNKTGPYSSIGGRTVIFLRTKYQNDSNDPRPDIEVIGGPPGDSIFGAIYLLNQKSRGSVKLTTTNPFVDPLPTGNYFSDANGMDVKVLCEGIRMLFALYQKINPAVHVTSGPSPDLSDGSCGFYLTGYAPYYIVGNSNTGNHWSGTARIGPASDPMAVVDPRLRVYGVTGLRVADASVFPEITSGNTQAPSYMVGEKAAAMILEDNA